MNTAILEAAAGRYARFIASTRDGDSAFRLTPRAEATPYARCFAIFGLHLVMDRTALDAGAKVWARAIRADLDRFRDVRRAAGATLRFDKPYLQLLTFSLSALSILGSLDEDPLAAHVEPVLPDDVDAFLREGRVLQGAPQSGNLAMFTAILLLHARDRLGAEGESRLQRWVSAHLSSMNALGFWGAATSMSHLQFQNGYHQYEIFEYLGTPVPKWPGAAGHVAALADADGHFAPYPGGGGCYDYDAVFMVTGAGDAARARHEGLLRRTAASIAAEQNADGGFGESQSVRPRSPRNLARTVRHVAIARGRARVERLRYGLSLLRPRHDRIHTHWSRYSREWGESNLWDSWFRMLTLARIAVAFDPRQASRWGFIDHPGIGYHATLGRGSSH